VFDLAQRSVAPLVDSAEAAGVITFYQSWAIAMRSARAPLILHLFERSAPGQGRLIARSS
jgi:hypothetical protein